MGDRSIVLFLDAVETWNQHDSLRFLLIWEQGEGLVRGLFQVTEAQDITERLVCIQNTVGPWKGLNETMIFKVLVDIQGVEWFWVKTGQEHIHHEQNIDFFFPYPIGNVTIVSVELIAWVVVLAKFGIVFSNVLIELIPIGLADPGREIRRLFFN